MQIGIVGMGYVGTAVQSAFEKHFQVATYDLKKDSTCSDLECLAGMSKVIFVCLPTPMNEDGSCDTSRVTKCVKDIDAIAEKNNIQGVIVILKSTIPPGTTYKIAEECPHLSIVFNPEFLTEQNFITDFENQNRVIIGGEEPQSIEIIAEIYAKVLPEADILKTSSMEAEMTKYLTNTFLATKVSFANEMKLLCDKLQIDYEKIVRLAIYDKRLGQSHWAVPGPDERFGFGGSCFPKDLNALMFLAGELGVSIPTLRGVWETNLNVRPERDWKGLKGRAVVKERK